MEDLELWEERLSLVNERIKEISAEQYGDEAFDNYFQSVALFFLQLEDTYNFLRANGLKNVSIEELQKRNTALYADILENHYEESYANPTFAVAKLGEEFGGILSFLYTEIRSLIGFVYENKLEEIVIRKELFVEVYSAFAYEWQENKMHPSYETVRQMIYWFVSDYADVAAINRTKELVTGEEEFAVSIIMNSNLSDIRYLYAYGEYISENEVQMAKFMAGLPEETINIMADTYTEGYRIGFILGNKDLSKKKVAEIRYRVGFERMIKRAIENFEKLGLKPVIYRNPYSILYNPSIYKTGFYGGEPNRQYDFDHKDDKAVFLDKNYINRRLEVSHTAFEQYKEAALGYAGPAVVETFGEKEFEPINKKESFKLSEEQSRLWVEYRSKAGEIQRNYILEEERSFTIIAFPIPEVGSVFEELFKETIKINTLDYKLYQGIQQKLIDTLDSAEYCVIKGSKDNCTDLRVSLKELSDPSKETKFENCVADVNIPVGEVFTSPVLKNTTGTLHVKEVYLNGLKFKDLKVVFEDGMITTYSCKNFESEEENKAFINENVLFRHTSLPMGEFAIGTNTTAYVIAKKLKVEDKLPILIAEKMGPHFAVGDTCYSHAEDIKVYNPDGKEIIARDNEVSLLRKTKAKDAYFNCHTDITIPYDELESLCAITADGKEIPIILKGRFVLDGTEELNKPFEQ